MSLELPHWCDRVIASAQRFFDDLPDTIRAQFERVTQLHPLPEFPNFVTQPPFPELIKLAHSPQLAPVRPFLLGLIVLLCLIFLLRAPHPLRGPRIPLKDSQRGYKIALRTEILTAAGHRCESPRFLAWGRCTAPATQVDHIYPWSRGGPTTRTNGQALCANHNRRKNAKKPAWWYIIGLERRRKLYYPVGSIIRVQAHPRRKKSRKNR